MYNSIEARKVHTPPNQFGKHAQHVTRPAGQMRALLINLEN